LVEVHVGDLKITAEDIQMVNSVLKSSRLSYGPYSRKFEHTFAKMHQSKFGVFTNSGTSALHIALSSIKEKYNMQDGDEVIIPATTFIATSNIVLYNNMKPVFVDVDSHSFNINPNKIEAAITEKTKAIIPVHLLGLPAEMDKIMTIAKKHGLRVIEDSAETMFAKYKGQSVGSFGDIGCFSTYVAHYIVTGVGGLNTTSDPELAVLLRSYANHGRDSIYINIDDDKTKDKKKLHEIIGKRFSFVRLGHSFRATEMEAALGLSQLKRKESIIRARKRTALIYRKGLSNLSEYLQFQEAPKGSENTYMLFGIVLKDGDKKDIVNHLEENGIETRDLLPLINQPVYKNLLNIDMRKYSVSEKLIKSGFYIGCHQYITPKEANYVVKVFHDFFRS
jgi:dTDP-4-amino-4,6-dideoxygalactose transaminase